LVDKRFWQINTTFGCHWELPLSLPILGVHPNGGNCSPI
jgi:hypothetical protein